MGTSLREQTTALASNSGLLLRCLRPRQARTHKSPAAKPPLSRPRLRPHHCTYPSRLHLRAREMLTTPTAGRPRSTQALHFGVPALARRRPLRYSRIRLTKPGRHQRVAVCNRGGNPPTVIPELPGVADREEMARRAWTLGEILVL